MNHKESYRDIFSQLTYPLQSGRRQELTEGYFGKRITKFKFSYRYSATVVL